MHQRRTMKAIIVGAGIGGLSTAIALRRAGIEARVFERATDLRRLQVGSGFFLWNNGVQALHDLGVAERLDAVSSPPLEQFEIRTPSGRQLVRMCLRNLERHGGAPCLGIPRGELQRVLSEALEEGVVQAGAECTGFTQDERGVTATFADRHEEHGDLLVAADGLNSLLRPLVVGKDRRRYAGYSMWFSLVESEVAALRVFRTFLGRGIRFTFLPVGPSRLAWVSIANAPAEGAAAQSRLKEMLLARHRGWTEPVEQVIAQSDDSRIHRLASYSRTPVHRWSDGRVVLVGDAAHPMTFNLAQGSCQAMEDAVSLARCLRHDDHVPSALLAFDRQRTQRVAEITRLSDRIGTVGTWESAPACALRSLLLMSFRPLIVKKLTEFALHAA